VSALGLVFMRKVCRSSGLLLLLLRIWFKIVTHYHMLVCPIAFIVYLLDQDHSCQSEEMIFHVQEHLNTTDNSISRQGFYSSSFTDFEACTGSSCSSTQCPADTGFCVNCNPTVCGNLVTITAIPGAPYLISVAGRGICRVGRDSQKPDQLRCY
jgi:hypothetical protein